MADDPRIQQLLDELFDSHATPEEVCGSCPELLPVVRDRWERLRRLGADLDALFPPPGDPPPIGDRGGGLPRIPGYEVEAVLGRGGQGVVFRARHLRLDRPVAVKMMPADAGANRYERDRFQREAEAVARLRHPNVVQVYDIGDVDGRPYFTMELIEGGSLARKLAGTPQPARQAAELAATLAGAVQAAHACGIVHRDLKPSNVLLTADGTPKVSDFGLARRLGDAAALTQTGVAVGTPSYMAPEQARGRPNTVGPAADVYALGAILYELLTGRPPFKGESAAETLHQVIFQDPVAPSLLSPKLPRDLETICLKCLQKDAPRRYVTAAAVEDDLGRYLCGEAIAARPEGRLERLARGLRRRPTLAVGLVAGLLLAVFLVGAGLWVWWEKSERERARASQAQAEEEQARAEAEQARATAEQARATAELARVDQARRDQQLAARLDAIRLNRSAVTESALDARSVKARADRDYESAFREAGFGQVQDDPDRVGARVADSNIRMTLIGALYDWAACPVDENRSRWVLAVVRRADPDASGWRGRVRDPKNWRDPAALAELAREARIADEPLVLLGWLGDMLRDSGQDATPYLRKVREAHPSDYWANVSLGVALKKTNPAESVRYFQVAEALRPGEFVPVGNLGCALLKIGQVDEAIACFQRVVDLAPGNPTARAYLGHALGRKRRLDEAVRELRRAVELDPNSAFSHTELAQSLLDLGQVEEAIAEAREAVRIDPDYAPGHYMLGMALFTQSPSKEALEHVEEAVRLDPNYAAAHSGLGTILRSAGRLDDAVKHAEQAVLLQPGVAHFRYNLANNLKAVNRRDEALAQYEFALRLDPAFGPAHHGIGTILLEDRRFDEAETRFRQAIKLDPTDPRPQAALGEVLINQGRLNEAATEIARGRELFPTGSPARAASGRHLAHCKSLITLDDRLEAVLSGDDAPADDRERLLFATLCRARKRYAAAARFAADAFARSPALADDMRLLWRYDAACSAAQAGCGLGVDAAELDDAHRSRWRKQARRWLQAELAAWTEKAAGSAADRRLVRKYLMVWRVDPGLAGLREPAAVGNLPADEREKLVAFWADVAALLARTEK
jgi:serine/threonine-protein kinase